MKNLIDEEVQKTGKNGFESRREIFEKMYASKGLKTIYHNDLSHLNNF